MLNKAGKGKSILSEHCKLLGIMVEFMNKNVKNSREGKNMNEKEWIAPEVIELSLNNGTEGGHTNFSDDVAFSNS